MSPSPHPLGSRSSDAHKGFFKVELELCFTFTDIAETSFKLGHRDSAESAMQKAQVGCATIQRFLSDDKHSAHLSQEEFRDTVAAWERLRDRLVELHRTYRV